MGATNLKFTIGGVEYKWSGGFGAQFHSYENDVREGDVRMVLGRLCYAFAVYRCSWMRAREVAWGMTGKTEVGDIDKLKSEIFGVK